MGWLPYWTVLIIPTGATSGQRIVIDGTNGQIVMYDAAGAPVITESASSGTIAIESADGTTQLQLGRVDDPIIGTAPGMSWHSSAPASVADGIVSLGFQAGPLGDPEGYAELTPPQMTGEPAGGVTTSMLVTRNRGDGNAAVNAGWFNGQMNAITSKAVTAPTWTDDGKFHVFTSAQWAPITIWVPPSAGIEVGIYLNGLNSLSAGSILAVSFQITDASNNFLFSPALGYAAWCVGPSNSQEFAQISIGSDVLAAYIGQQVTITPTYRVTSGSGTDPVLNNGRLTVRPAIYAVETT